MILFYGTVVFSLAFLLHLLIWRIRLPKSQARALLQVFFSTLLISFIVLWHRAPFITILEFFHIALFFTSLTLVYITTYPAMEADSPSLIMVMSIARTGSAGLNKQELLSVMTDERLVKPRIKDLIEAKMIYLDKDNKYRLSKKGALFISVFIFYCNNLLRKDKGG